MNFEKYLEKPRRLRPPDPPSYVSWIGLRVRLNERLGNLDQDSLESVIQNLFEAGNILNGPQSEVPYGPHIRRFIKGWLDVDGLHYLIANHIDAFILESETCRIFADLDTDNDGKVDFEAFREAIIANLQIAISTLQPRTKLNLSLINAFDATSDDLPIPAPDDSFDGGDRRIPKIIS